jgi:hypothetical protein
MSTQFLSAIALKNRNVYVTAIIIRPLLNAWAPNTEDAKCSTTPELFENSVEKSQ